MKRDKAIKAASKSRLDKHDFVLTDMTTDKVIGTYPTQELAYQALQKHMQPGRVLNLDVLHPGCAGKCEYR
jgi:hypothetical protein